jgi:uncharacterized protein YkwD
VFTSGWNYAAGKGNGSVASHFTQVVWKSTARVGCGYKKCPALNNLAGWGQDIDYLICRCACMSRACVPLMRSCAGPCCLRPAPPASGCSGPGPGSPLARRRYDPPGNTNGQHVANVLAPAAAAGSSRPPPQAAKRAPPPSKPLRPPPPKAVAASQRHPPPRTNPLHRPPPPRKAGATSSAPPPAKRPPPPAKAMRPPPPAVATPGALRPILDLHNALRRKHGVPALEWSPALAAAAAGWANRCTWGNDPFAQQGENIYAATGGAWNVTEPADIWYSEVGQWRGSGGGQRALAIAGRGVGWLQGRPSRDAPPPGRGGRARGRLLGPPAAGAGGVAAREGGGTCPPPHCAPPPPLSSLPPQVYSSKWSYTAGRGNGFKSDQFSQLVWRASRALGCAYKKCASLRGLADWVDVDYVVCR